MQAKPQALLLLFAGALLVSLGVFLASSEDTTSQTLELPIRSAVPLDGAQETGLGEPLRAESRASLNPSRSPERLAAGASQRLALEPLDPASMDLIVLALDTGGQPLEGLWVWVSSTPDVRASMRSEPFHAKSDEHGRIVFKDVRKTLLEGKTWYLVHDVAFERLPRTRLTPALLEQAEIVTVQPAFGSIVVNISEHDETPSEHVQRLELQLIGDAEADTPRLAFTRQHFLGQALGGTCTYPYVELGREWGVLAERGNDFDTRERTQGPRLARQTIQIDVQYGSDRPILWLRAVTEAGAPLPSVLVTLQLQSVSGRYGESVMTDARGEFALHLGLEAAGIFGSGLHASYTNTRGVEFRGERQELGELHDGLNQLGDLPLYESETMLSGRVVDASGAPRGGVTVRAGESEDWDSEFGMGSYFLENVTDPEGRFTISGHEAWDEYKLWAFERGGRASASAASERPRDARSSVRSVQSGETGIELVLETWIRPRVELLLPEGAASHAIRLTLTSVADSSLQKSVRDLSRNSANQLLECIFEPLQPGVYDLLCSLRNQDRTLLELKGLHVETESSLSRIDLRDRIFVHRIHLRADERVEEGGEYCFRQADSEQEWLWQRFTGASVNVVTLFKRVDVRVFPKSFLGQTLEGLTGEVDLALQAAYRLRLLLQTTGEIPRLPNVFSVQLKFEGHALGHIVGPRSFRDDLRELLVDVPVAGQLALGWYYELHAAHFSISGSVLPQHALQIEVRETDGEQVIELPLDAEALTDLARHSPFR